MSGHTKEPWRYISRNVDGKENWACRIPFAIIRTFEGISAVAPIADIVADPLVEVCDQPCAEANASRIVACVNAMAGIDDPVKFVKDETELKALLAEVNRLLIDCIEIHPRSPIHERIHALLSRIGGGE